MSKLLFIRRKATHESWDYYEMKTEVWIFGDVAGYVFFQEQLRQAVGSDSNIHLALLAENPNSMRGVILPAQKTERKSALLKLIERFVWIDEIPNMELVIAGNAAGYQKLVDSLACLIDSGKSDPTEHDHFNDIPDRCVVPRSVALNIRAPLQQWRIEDLAEFSNIVQHKGEDFLPKELAYRLESKEDYSEVTFDESEIVRLDSVSANLFGFAPH